MTASLVIITLFWNLLAPAPPQIAINPETKECGYYWGGDEYAWYHLPSQWVIVNPDTPIQTEVGVYEWDGSTSSIESFCRQIGYTYVSGNLGKVRGQYRLSAYAYILLAFKFAPLIIVFTLLMIAFVLFLRWINKQSNNASTS
jgi:hypothetical protein